MSRNATARRTSASNGRRNARNATAAAAIVAAATPATPADVAAAPIIVSATPATPAADVAATPATLPPDTVAIVNGAPVDGNGNPAGAPTAEETAAAERAARNARRAEETAAARAAAETAAALFLESAPRYVRALPIIVSAMATESARAYRKANKKATFAETSAHVRRTLCADVPHVVQLLADVPQLLAAMAAADKETISGGFIVSEVSAALTGVAENVSSIRGRLAVRK